MDRRSRFRRALLAALALTAVGLVVAACGKTSNAPASGSASSGSSSGGGSASASAVKPKEGGNLTFLIQEFPLGWASSLSSFSSYEGNLWRQIADNLVYVSSTGKVSPWLLSSWQTEDNATKFILHIKPGITFSDGEPLNAAAVVDNINLWARGDKARGIAQVALFPALSYVGAKATGTDTVEVDFAKPTLGFIPTLGYAGCIVLAPKTLAEPVSQQAVLTNDIGTGPFVVKSYKQGVSYTLVKRKDYDWGSPAFGHTGPAYLNSITFKVVADATTREEAVEAGDAQVAYDPNVADIPTLKAKGLSIGTPKYLGFTDGFYIQADEAPFNELAVRQALQHAINRQAILNTVYPSGFTTVAESFVQSNVPEAQDDSSLMAYDPSESEKLLTAAGWKVGAGGYRYKDGTELKFNLIPNPYVPSTQQEDELISQQLKAVGIDAPLKIIPLANYLVVEKPPIPPVLSQSRSFADFSTVGGVLTSLNDGEDLFGVGTSDKTLDKLSDEIESASTTAQRDTYAAEVQKYVLEQGYFDPILNLVQRVYAYAPDVHAPSYSGTAFADFYDAWVS
jgi:peptide/nickel transport system substrate-binding protein